MTITSSTIPWTISDRSAVRTGDDVRALPLALKSEWIKLASLRANKVILALTAGIGAVIAGGLAATATDPTLTASELFIYPLPLVAMLATVTGIQTIWARRSIISMSSRWASARIERASSPMRLPRSGTAGSACTGLVSPLGR